MIWPSHGTKQDPNPIIETESYRDAWLRCILGGNKPTDQEEAILKAGIDPTQVQFVGPLTKSEQKHVDRVKAVYEMLGYPVYTSENTPKGSVVLISRDRFGKPVIHS